MKSVGETTLETVVSESPRGEQAWLGCDRRAQARRVAWELLPGLLGNR